MPCRAQAPAPADFTQPSQEAGPCHTRAQGKELSSSLCWNRSSSVPGAASRQHSPARRAQPLWHPGKAVSQDTGEGNSRVESCSSPPSGRPQLQVREHQIPNLILEEWPRLQTARRQSPGRALNFQLSHLGKGVRVGAGQAACGGTAPVRCTALQGCEPAPSPERTGRPGWAAELRSPGDHEQLDFPRSTVASLPGEARRRQRWCPLGEPEPPEAPEESGVAKTGRSCWSGPLTPDPRPPG